MKCTRCETDVTDIFDTPIGLVCWNCYWSNFLNRLGKPRAGSMPAEHPFLTQMRILESVGTRFESQFLTETKGAVLLAVIERECKKSPSKIMRVGYYDAAKKGPMAHAEFSCS
jgi:hypothetical protein